MASNSDACFGTYTRRSKSMNLPVLPQAISIDRRPFSVQVFSHGLGHGQACRKFEKCAPQSTNGLSKFAIHQNNLWSWLSSLHKDCRNFKSSVLKSCDSVRCSTFNAIKDNQRVSSGQDPIQYIFPWWNQFDRDLFNFELTMTGLVLDSRIRQTNTKRTIHNYNYNYI